LLALRPAEALLVPAEVGTHGRARGYGSNVPDAAAQFGLEEMRETAAMEAVRYIIAGGHEAKT
jgi:hypothetical protein